MSWYRFLSISCHCEPPYTIQLPPIRSKISISKVECAYPMVIRCEFRMGQYKEDDHQEDASHFRFYRTLKESHYWWNATVFFVDICASRKFKILLYLQKRLLYYVYLYGSVEFFQCSRWLVMNTHTRRFQRLSLIYV